MKRLFHALLTVGVLSLLFFSFGCATQGINTIKYDPPSDNKKMINERTSNRPYTEVWDHLMKNLSKSFFVINNVDKESRIINVSFSTNTPADYADCGTTHRTYSGDKVMWYNYKTAESARFLVAAERQPNKNFSYYYKMRRQTDLDGRINIYVAPAENNKTRTVVTANARYTLTIKSAGEAFAQHWGGNILSVGAIPENSVKITFDTARSGELLTDEGITLTCRTTGLLENQVLEMVIE